MLKQFLSALIGFLDPKLLLPGTLLIAAGIALGYNGHDFFSFAPVMCMSIGGGIIAYWTLRK